MPGARSDGELTIGEVARRTGVPASTLRFWERTGLLTASGRVGGKRRYDPQVLRRISLIALTKRAGFTLAESRVLLAGFSERTPPSQLWRELAERKLPAVEQAIVQANAIKAMLEAGLRCECVSIEECLSR